MKLALAVLLSLAGAAHAVPFKAYGVGTLTCGDYLSYRAESTSKDQNNSVFVSYVWGFISGRNQEAATGRQLQVSGELSNGTILAFADKYCRENPLEYFPDAINELVAENIRRQLKPIKSGRP